MIVRKFINVLKALSLNLTMSDSEMSVFPESSCITYKSNQFFDFVLFFMDVDVRFIFKNWSSNNKNGRIFCTI